MKRPFASPFLLALATLLSLPACGDGGETGTGGSGGGTTTTESPDAPADPAANDPAYAVTGVPRYVLQGDDLTPSTPTFEVRVATAASVSELGAWVDGGAYVPLTKEGDQWVAAIAAADLDVGVHHLVLGEPGADTAFFAADFTKGHALYVIVSTDWDFPDVADKVLEQHATLHAEHPEIKITHLIGPYTFTDPAIPQARRDLLADWAKGMRDMHGDEIGLHIHPRCTFVEAAGLTCKTQPSVQDPAGDATGYTVHLGAYSREEWNTMFAKADDIWASLGFGKPTSFRAGAWTLELSTAQALADSGFLVDSSAVNWPYMEEWEGYDLYTWNQAQWAPIGDTSQPYYPTEDSLLPGGKEADLTLLEVPDNGVMVDYWTVEEMKGIFDANWSGQPLDAPTQVSTGFHPAPDQYYSSSEYLRLKYFFNYVDGFLASQGAGPVVYITMTDATKVW